MGEHKDENTDLTSHTPGTAKGEEMAGKDGKEPGREAQESGSGESRPEAGSTARISTSINPEDREPIDPKMPNMPPA
jgi:hypothetical protein